jgi:hypothetical protein
MSDRFHVKQGDQVARVSRGSGATTYTLHTVTKATRTGYITLDNGERYSPDGKEVGCTRPNRIVEVTEKIREFIRREKAIQQLHNYMYRWHRLPTALLEQLAEVLAAQEPEPTS